MIMMMMTVTFIMILYHNVRHLYENALPLDGMRHLFNRKITSNSNILQEMIVAQLMKRFFIVL